MPQEGVAQLVRDLPRSDDPNLVVGPEDFSDGGVYRLRDDLLVVQSVDFFPPLVDDPVAFGRIAAANSLSDVFAMGGSPTTVLNVVGFPDDKLPLSILGEILRGSAEKVQEAGAVVVGGHTVRDTEIKFGLAVTGTVEPSRLLTNREAKPGDVLLLTKPIGTGFITTAFKAGRCPDEVLEAAVDSMTQLNSIGRDAAHAAAAHAVTDITGFGLAGHANELAQASGVTVVIDVARVPELPGALSLAQAGYMTRASASNRGFAEATTRIASGVDPLRLELLFDAQTSGGLLISLPPDRADEAVALAKNAGATAAVIIGHVEEQQDASLVLRDS